MKVKLEEARKGRLMARDGRMVGFPVNQFESELKELKPGDEINIEITGYNQENTVFFWRWVKDTAPDQLLGMQPDVSNSCIEVKISRPDALGVRRVVRLQIKKEEAEKSPFSIPEEKWRELGAAIQREKDYEAACQKEEGDRRKRAAEREQERQRGLTILEQRAGTFRLEGYEGLIFRALSSFEGRSPDEKGIRTYDSVSFIVPGTVLFYREEYRDEKGHLRGREHHFSVTKITEEGLLGKEFTFSGEEGEESLIPPHILAGCRRKKSPVMSPEDERGLSFLPRYVELKTWERRLLVPAPGERRAWHIPDYVRDFFKNNSTSYYYEYVVRTK